MSQRAVANPEPVVIDVAPTNVDGAVSTESSPDPLTDKERVLQLLEDNDGRMPQTDIVEETQWSAAKVSQLLTKMDDNDDLVKIRLGRANIIVLPDEDVVKWVESDQFTTRW